jgi:hypothetical protein
MKAIIDNKITYKVTGERGMYTITECGKGKVKMFLTTTIEIIEIDEMPKSKVYRKMSAVSQSAHNRFMNDMREAQFQENYLECQRSTKF